MIDATTNPALDAPPLRASAIARDPEKESLEREKAYLDGRWQKQKTYYSDRVAHYKKWYQRIRIFTALTAVVIPILLSIPGINTGFPTILSALVAMATVTEGVYGFGDNWRNFRKTLEVLKRERTLFDARVEPYNDPDTAFPLFVKNCESAIAQETGEYFTKDQEQS